MFKRFLLSGLLLLPFLTYAQIDSVTISGVIQSSDDNPVKKVSFSFTDSGGKNHSTTAKVDGFFFAFKVPKQTVVADGMLRTISSNSNLDVMQHPLTLFIEKENINVNGNRDEMELAFVTGGKDNEAYNILRQSTANVTRDILSLYAPLIKGDVKSGSEEAKDILKKVSLLNKELYASQRNFVASNPDSYVSLFLLFRMKNIYTSDDYKEAFNALNDRFGDTKMGQTIQYNIQKEQVTSKGVVVPSFERTTATGQNFRLESLRGRVFLLDFWGSWCAPCIASMPHLWSLYEKYKDHGFEIVGVAQERGKTKDDAMVGWKKAIDNLGIHWVNVLNNENKEEFDIVKSYNISGFPTKILVDEDGKVLLRITASATDDIDLALKKIYGY